MSDKPQRQYLPASSPDIVARLHHALEANESARVLMNECVASLELHLEQLDQHVRQLIKDIEGRAH